MAASKDYIDSCIRVYNGRAFCRACGQELDPTDWATLEGVIDAYHEHAESCQDVAVMREDGDGRWLVLYGDAETGAER